MFQIFVAIGLLGLTFGMMLSITMFGVGSRSNVDPADDDCEWKYVVDEVEN